MLKIIHRVNTIELLKKMPHNFGVEIDLRAYGEDIVLTHEPFLRGDLFNEYLKNYHHAFIILNIKEAGIEDHVLSLLKKYNIKNYFLLDVEFPYIYRAVRQGVRNIAIRYSEDEPIEMALKYKQFVDWVWIDTNSRLPLNKSVIKKLAGFKTCLVSPERWGRPEDIKNYQKEMSEYDFHLDAVMTEFSYVNFWEE
jgi:hypothetical protein